MAISIRRQAAPQPRHGADQEGAQTSPEAPLARRLKVAKIQPSRAVPSPAGTSEGALPEQVPAAQRCRPHATRAQLPREPRGPTQSSVIGAAPVLSGLFSIKTGSKIGTSCRKGRDPPQNTNCQETLLTRDEETHTADMAQNVRAGQVTQRQPHSARLPACTFFLTRTSQHQWGHHCCPP